MAKQKFDRCSECLMSSHILFNVVFAASSLLFFELNNPHYPFSMPFLPIEVSLALALLFFLLILAIVLASSIHVMSSHPCFCCQIITESALSSAIILSLILSGSDFFSLVFIYLALGATNGLLLVVIRKRMSLQLENACLFHKLLKSMIIHQPDTQTLPDCCSICLEDFQRGPVIGLSCTPFTKHYFHLQCARLWFRSSHACPLCRGVGFLKRRRFSQERAAVYPAPQI